MLCEINCNRRRLESSAQYHIGRCHLSHSPQCEDLVLLHVTLPVLFPRAAPAVIVRLDDAEMVCGGVAVLADDPCPGALEDHPRNEKDRDMPGEVRHGVRHPVPRGRRRYEWADRAVAPHMAAVRLINPGDPAPRVVVAAGIVESSLKSVHQVFRTNPIHPGMGAVAFPARW